MIGQQLYFQKAKATNPIMIPFAATTEILDVAERSGQIWVCGRNGFVAKSLDGGATWTQWDVRTIPALGWTGDVNVVFGSHGFFPNQWRIWGANNLAAYTNDGGTTWVSNNMTSAPAATISDVDDTSGYLVGGSLQGQYGVNVAGDFGASGQTGAGDSWLAACRDPADVTHVLVGSGNKIYYGLFGWPPPAGHLIGTYTKGTAVQTQGAYFDSSKNLMFINADGSYGYKNQPAYSVTAPAIFSNPLMTSGGTYGITHDRVNTNTWMVCGEKSGTDRMWTSTQAAPHTWTELNPYAGYGVALWRRVDRDNTRGTWVTGGRTTANQGCVGIWKV